MIGIDKAKKKYLCRVCNDYGQKGDVRVWSNSHSMGGEGTRFYHPECLVRKLNEDSGNVNPRDLSVRIFSTMWINRLFFPKDKEKVFKCRNCGEKHKESFCSTKDVGICRWCSGEEK